MTTPFMRRSHTEIISSFRQLNEETLKEAWKRMKDMLEEYDGHLLFNLQIIEIFYNGLNLTSANVLNSFSQNHFLNQFSYGAMQILDDMLISNWDDELWKIKCFMQLEEEDLEKAWSRIEDLLGNNQDPLSSQEILEYFYFGLDYNWREILDYASGGYFLKNSYQKSLQILEQKLYFEKNFATEDPDTWFEKRNKPISSSDQSNSSFENDQHSSVYQNDFEPENSNCLQENLWEDNFENSSSCHQKESNCENLDQYQNDLYHENHDFSQNNSDSCNENLDVHNEPSIATILNAIKEFGEWRSSEFARLSDALEKMNESMQEVPPAAEPYDEMNDNCNFYYSNNEDAGVTNQVSLTVESVKGKIEYHDTDSDEELTVKDVQRIFRILSGKESILVPETVEDDFSDNDETKEKRSILVPEPVEDDFTDNEIENEDYQTSLESVDTDLTNDQSTDEEIVLESVKDLFTEEESTDEGATDLSEPEPINTTVADKEEEEVLVQVIGKLEDAENEQMQEFPKLIVGNWGDCEDDFSDDETVEEEVMMEQEPVEENEESNLLQPVHDESIEEEFDAIIDEFERWLDLDEETSPEDHSLKLSLKQLLQFQSSPLVKFFRLLFLHVLK